MFCHILTVFGCCKISQDRYSVTYLVFSFIPHLTGDVLAGDQLLEVNGQNMQGITYDR